MICMPVWVSKESEEGIHALLGSEPRTDSPLEWIPRACLESLVFAEAPAVEGKRFAMVVLRKEQLTDRLQEVLGLV